MEVGRERLAHSRVFEIAFLPGPPGCDSEDVRVQRDNRGAEGNRTDRPSGVRADAGKLLEGFDGAGELPRCCPDQFLRRRMKAPCASVVPRPLPDLQDVLDRGRT